MSSNEDLGENDGVLSAIAERNKQASRHEKRMYRQGILKTLFIGVGLLVIAAGPALKLFSSVSQEDYIALIRMSGVIQSGASETDGLKLSESLISAFGDDKAKGILIVANSVGGSPVQAEMLYSTLKHYKEITKKPVWVSIEDNCASAYYWSVSVADKIFAHETSLVGSIGIRMDMWNFSK